MKHERVKSSPIVIDGIQFRSKLESYCYTKLRDNNIKAVYEGATYTIIPEFTFQDKKIRPITYTPDFVGDNFIIECKGWQHNEAFPLRWKLFKLYLNTHNLKYDVYLLKNKHDIDEAIELIKVKGNVRTRRTSKAAQRVESILSILF